MTRAELLYNALVLFVLTTVAAVLQDVLPPLPWGGVKPPFLLGVATYYVILRPLSLAAPAILWCGLLQDGLGSLPDGVALAGLVALWAFCALWGRAQLPESRLTCLWIGACAAAVLSLAEYASLRASGLLPSLPWSFILSRAAVCAAYAVPVCAAAALAGGLLDRMAHNIRTEHDADGFDWSNGRV